MEISRKAIMILKIALYALQSSKYMVPFRIVLWIASFSTRKRDAIIKTNKLQVYIGPKGIAVYCSKFMQYLGKIKKKKKKSCLNSTSEDTYFDYLSPLTFCLLCSLLTKECLKS